MHDGPADIADHLSALERSLLDPKMRANKDDVSGLLAEDFVEFGSSGRVWKRPAIIAVLAGEAATDQAAPTVDGLKVRMLADAAALVTYTVSREDSSGTLRSSIWERQGGKWRMVFHQGTPRNTGIGR